MEIGPFSIGDLTSLEEILQNKGVQYQVLVDEEEKERLLEQFRSDVNYNPRHMQGSLDMKIVYIEIADSDFEKIKDVMENYGIVPISDGSFELGEE